VPVADCIGPRNERQKKKAKGKITAQARMKIQVAMSSASKND
jgi:hypothetical protein